MRHPVVALAVEHFHVCAERGTKSLALLAYALAAIGGLPLGSRQAPFGGQGAALFTFKAYAR
jgi:hypothetical protein